MLESISNYENMIAVIRNNYYIFNSSSNEINSIEVQNKLIHASILIFQKYDSIPLCLIFQNVKFMH